MIDHINGVMSHFKGKVTVWDVVNEAFDHRRQDRRRQPEDARLGLLDRDRRRRSSTRRSWRRARRTPSALLVYNEFASEGLSDKSTAVYNMVKDMKMRGIPIDGVGLQMHIGYNTNPTAADVAANMQRLADLGLEGLHQRDGRQRLRRLLAGSGEGAVPRHGRRLRRAACVRGGHGLGYHRQVHVAGHQQQPQQRRRLRHRPVCRARCSGTPTTSRSRPTPA